LTIRGSNLGRGKRYLPSPKRRDLLWGPSCVIFSGCRGFFQGIKRPEHVPLDIYLVPRLAIRLLWGPSCVIFSGCRGFFQGIKRPEHVPLDIYLVPRLAMSGDIPLPLYTPTWPKQGHIYLSWREITVNGVIQRIQVTM